MSNGRNSGGGGGGGDDSTLSFDEALEKIEARFIYNLPETELLHIERLFFQIEQAHWFYEDFLVEKYSNLPSYKFKNFTEKLFQHCKLLQPLHDKCSLLCDDFNSYRYQIPVCGCILLNSDMTKVVLVRNWKGTSWSFPKGKINEDEELFHCALRETFEETGFNPIEYCSEDHYLVVYEEKKITRLYIAVGVPESTVFNTQTRKEISRVEFHSLDQLPKKAWGVHPFLEKLQRWIRKHERLIQGGGGVNNNNQEQKNKIAIRKKSATPSRFDERNEDTFGGEVGSGGGSGGNLDSGWSVQDMFAVNSRLTGQTYSYDGNPHNFGNRHPQYVNYVASNSTTTTAPSTSTSSSTSSSASRHPHPLSLPPPPPSSSTSSSFDRSQFSSSIFQPHDAQSSLPKPPFNQLGHNDHNTNMSENYPQNQNLITKTQSIFSQISSSPPPSLGKTATHMGVNKQYFPSPFVFDTQKILQKVDLGLGITNNNSGKRGGGRRHEN